MSNRKEQSSDNVSPIGNSPARAIRASIQALRESLALSWRVRGLMLTPEEHEELREEISHAYELLKLLTAGTSSAAATRGG